MGSKTSGRHTCVLLYDRNEFPVGIFLSNKEIAKFLDFNEDTVRHAISRCYAGKQKFVYDRTGKEYIPYRLKEN